MQQNHKEPIYDVKEFWDAAEKALYLAINEKNATQYKIQLN